jgi:hypothetical protein
MIKADKYTIIITKQTILELLNAIRKAESVKDEEFIDEEMPNSDMNFKTYYAEKFKRGIIFVSNYNESKTFEVDLRDCESEGFKLIQE